MADPSLSARRRALLVGVASGRGALFRVWIALGALAGVIVFGTIGYTVLGFTPLEATYQTVTTVATVGYREVRPLSPAGMVFTMVLILLGVGTVLYNLGILVEAVTEGHLREYLERRRMDQQISGLSGHIIICGYGRVGRAAAAHLLATGHRGGGHRQRPGAPGGGRGEPTWSATRSTTTPFARQASCGRGPSSPPWSRTPTPCT